MDFNKSSGNAGSPRNSRPKSSTVFEPNNPSSRLPVNGVFRLNFAGKNSPLYMPQVSRDLLYAFENMI